MIKSTETYRVIVIYDVCNVLYLVCRFWSLFEVLGVYVFSHVTVCSGDVMILFDHVYCKSYQIKYCLYLIMLMKRLQLTKKTEITPSLYF